MQALVCNVDLRCNTLDVLQIADSDWECRCHIKPKVNPDLTLVCVLSSTTTG